MSGRLRGLYNKNSSARWLFRPFKFDYILPTKFEVFRNLVVFIKSNILLNAVTERWVCLFIKLLMVKSARKKSEWLWVMDKRNTKSMCLQSSRWFQKLFYAMDYPNASYRRRPKRHVNKSPQSFPVFHHVHRKCTVSSLKTTWSLQCFVGRRR